MNLWQKIPKSNAAMILFSVLGLWLISDWVATWGSAPGQYIAPYRGSVVILVAILAIALVRLPRSLFHPQAEDRRPTMDDLARPFLRALRSLKEQRWLLWLFGIVFAVNFLGGMLDSVLAWHSFSPAERNSVQGVTSWMDMGNSLTMDYLQYYFAGDLSKTIASAPTKLVPSIGISGTQGASIVWLAVMFLGGFWMYRRLGRTSERHAGDRSFGLTRNLVLVAAVVSALLVPLVAAVIHHYASLGHQDSPDFGDIPMLLLLSAGFYLILDVFLQALLMAGLIGSLLRVRKAEHVTADSFIVDAARYWMPIAGFYLLLALIVSIVNLPLIALMWAQFRGRSPMTAQPPAYLNQLSTVWSFACIALGFVPFAIVTRRLGMWRGIVQGVRDWFRNAWSVISFLAFGTIVVTILSVLHTVLPKALGALIPASSIYRFHPLAVLPNSIVWNLIGTLMTALVTLVLWDLYWRLTKTGASSPTDESDAST